MPPGLVVRLRRVKSLNAFAVKSRAQMLCCRALFQWRQNCDHSC